LIEIERKNRKTPIVAMVFILCLSELKEEGRSTLLIERILVALKDRILGSFAAPSGEVGFGSNSLAHQVPV
jgi:hypothetical protein